MYSADYARGARLVGVSDERNPDLVHLRRHPSGLSTRHPHFHGPKHYSRHHQQKGKQVEKR